MTYLALNPSKNLDSRTYLFFKILQNFEITKNLFQKVLRHLKSYLKKLILSFKTIFVYNILFTDSSEPLLLLDKQPWYWLL